MTKIIKLFLFKDTFWNQMKEDYPGLKTNSFKRSLFEFNGTGVVSYSNISFIRKSKGESPTVFTPEDIRQWLDEIKIINSEVKTVTAA